MESPYSTRPWYTLNCNKETSSGVPRHYELDQPSLKRVHRRTTKLDPELEDLPYAFYVKHLRWLYLPSLYYHGNRGDIVEMYQVMIGVEHTDPERFFK